MKRIHKLIMLTYFLLVVTILSVACSKGATEDTSGDNVVQDTSTAVSGLAGTEDITNEVTTNEVPSNEVTSNEVTSNEITSNEVTSNEVTSNDVTSNEVTSNEVTSGNNSSDVDVQSDENSIKSFNSSSDSEDLSDDDTAKKKIIAIDAGHQRKGNYEKEPIGPGAKTTKPKVSSGTQGVYTKVAEYELNLAVALKVKKELLDRGYEVVMIRETNDVNLSNMERAQIATESGADLFIRIHADGSTDPKVTGASTLYPSKKNPYVSDLSASSYSLSKAIVNAICDNTGAKNRGAIARDDMSGINWCTIPVTIIEMGYMTNKTEDKLMQTKKYQNKIVKGICDGIDQYFE